MSQKTTTNQLAVILRDLEVLSCVIKYGETTLVLQAGSALLLNAKNTPWTFVANWAKSSYKTLCELGYYLKDYSGFDVSHAFPEDAVISLGINLPDGRSFTLELDNHSLVYLDHRVGCNTPFLREIAEFVPVEKTEDRNMVASLNENDELVLVKITE